MMEIPYTVDQIVKAVKDTVRVDRPAVVLHPADRVLRLRRDGAQHAAVQGRRVDRVLAVGRVPRRRRGQQGRAHEDLVVDAPRPQHDAAAVEDHRQLRELVAREGRGAEGRLRRGDHAQPRRARVGVHRREHLRRRGTACSSRRRSRPARCPGITQDSVTTIAHDHGFEVRVDDLSRSDLYVAEEMFVCGTAAEVSAVNSVDDRAIPCPGPMTKVIANEYATRRPRPGRQVQRMV